MQTETYNRMLNFMAQLESVATSDKEKDVINSARGMLAKAQFEAGTAGTMDVSIPTGNAPDFTSGTMSHSGPKSKAMSQDERDAFNADVNARNKQWKRQLSGLRRRVKTAEHTLEEYAEVAPGELDAWVENTLRPTIEAYLDSEEGGLVWADENKKKVKRERGAGGFITPAMKRAQYDEDKKKMSDIINKSKEGDKKKAEDDLKKSLEADKAKEGKGADTAPAEGAKEEKKEGAFEKLKGIGKKALKALHLMDSVSDTDLRSCFESVFGNSEHLSDDTIRAICYNALDRKFR